MGPNPTGEVDYVPSRITWPALSYELVHKLTDLDLMSVKSLGGKPKHGRQHLNIFSLESVVLWLASHGTDELRKEMLWRAAGVLDPKGRSGRTTKS